VRILVTGASGFIGRGCVAALSSAHEVRGTYRSRPAEGLMRLDLLDSAEVSRVLEACRPEAIVHCAARSSVDWCEENPAEARQLNVDTTLALLAAARRIGARVAFLSTDYVFDGTAGPYSEGDPVRPINVYGRLKLEMEQVALAENGNLVVRTTNVYGYDPQSKNFLMPILPLIARGKTIVVADDQWGTPTLVEDLAETIRALLEQRVAGVVHVAGPDYVNRAEWARLAVAMFGLDPGRVVAAPTVDLKQAALRPLRAGLACLRLPALDVPVPRPLAAGIGKMKRDWVEAGGW
jgi:dTDP-4-dehydrorhamnose reductase